MVGGLQIYVVELELLEGGFESSNWVCDAAHYFGCDIELASVDAAFFDGEAEFWFRLVDWDRC